MKNVIGQRLNDFIKSQNISQQELADMLGVPKQNISSWINGVTGITTKYLPSLAEMFLNLNMRWLLTGKGSMTDDKKVSGIVENSANEPTSPYISECNNPICAEKIKNLSDTVEDLRADKKWLQEELRRREVIPEKYASGGVAKNRNAG